MEIENKIKIKIPLDPPSQYSFFAMLQYRNTPLKANSVELLCSLNIEILSDVETNSLDLYFQFLLFVSFFCHYNDFKKAALFTKAVHQEKKNSKNPTHSNFHHFGKWIVN